MSKSKYRYDFERYFHEEAGMKILADPHQYEYVKAMLAPPEECQIIFVDAPAGSGKTSLALHTANYLMNKVQIDKIIYARNAVAIRDTGFLPGTVEEKEAVYMRPIRDFFNSIGQDQYEDMLFLDQLEVTTTSYLRGVDIPGRRFLILDEAQNLDIGEIQTLLTRVHDSLKVVVIGSTRQVDNQKVKRYGPDKLLPFEVFMKHFDNYDKVPSKNLELVNNYRGNLSQHADNIYKTIKALQEQG